MKKLLILIASALPAHLLQSQNVGIGINNPSANLHLLQTDGLMAGAGGMVFDANSKKWKIYNSFSHFSFAENGVRRAYVEAGTGDWTQPSDMRLKENIEPLGKVLHAVLQLQPSRYNYINTEKMTLGFIAQQVQPIFPEIVHVAEDGELALAYKDFGILAIKAIQEQQALIELQNLKIQELSQKIKKLEEAVLAGN